MTKPFLQTLNQIHKKCWKESDDRGRINPDQIKNIIKKEAGYTVVDKYWDELHNFERIEQIPEEQKWIVTKPEEAGLNLEQTGEKKVKQVMIPEEIIQVAEQYGINFSAVMTEKLIEEVSNKEQFIEDYLGDNYNEKETEYIFELLKNKLYTKQGDKREMSRRNKRRRQIYRKIFSPEHITSEEAEHIEELRQQTFKLHEILDL